MQHLDFFKKNIASILGVVMFFAAGMILISSAAAAAELDPDTYAFIPANDIATTSTDTLQGYIYVPPLHDYDLGVFTCTIDGVYPTILLDDFSFQGYATTSVYEYHKYVNHWSVFDILVPGDILPGLWPFEISIDKTTTWYCNFSLFDFADREIGSITRSFVSGVITNPYNFNFTSSGDDDRLFFVHAEHCTGCGDLGTNSNFFDVVSDENPNGTEYFGLSWQAQEDGDGVAFTANYPGKNGKIGGQGYAITLEYSEDVDTDIDPDAYFTIGDYVVPRTINCYLTDEYCRMVFGYDMAAYSRALTEANPDDQEYPAFAWWWPDTTATTSVYAATLREHIVRGEQLYATFAFPTPTSTTSYTLEIEDPGDGVIGSSTSFVVDVSVIGSSTGSIMTTCLGSCDDGLLGEIFCGVKKAVCFFVIPSDDATLYIRAGYEKISSVAPLSYITGLTASMRSGMAQDDDRSGAFAFPMIDKTGDIYMQDVLTTSSVSNLIGEDNENIFRKTLVYLIWIFLSVGIIIFLINRSK